MIIRWRAEADELEQRARDQSVPGMSNLLTGRAIALREVVATLRDLREASRLADTLQGLATGTPEKDIDPKMVEALMKMWRDREA